MLTTSTNPLLTYPFDAAAGAERAVEHVHLDVLAEKMLAAENFGRNVPHPHLSNLPSRREILPFSALMPTARRQLNDSPGMPVFITPPPRIPSSTGGPRHKRGIL